jgi:hypothetical protein
MAAIASLNSEGFCRWCGVLGIARIMDFVHRLMIKKQQRLERAFWDVTPCSLAGVDRRFRGAYCLHHQGDEISYKNNGIENGSLSVTRKKKGAPSLFGSIGRS